MNNETEMRDRAIAATLHTGRSDLLAEYMKTENGVSQPVLSNKDVASDVSHAPSILYWGSVSLAVSTVALVGAGGALLTYDSLGPWSLVIPLASFVVGLVGVPKLAANIFKAYDAKRLNAYMVSDNIMERNYYVNRVLTYLLKYNSEATTLFDNPYILGYTLRFVESLKERPLWFRSNRLRRLFLAESDMGYFESDPSYPMYLEIAKDMINGVFEKEPLPVETKTVGQRELLKKAQEIVNRRYVNRETLKPKKIIGEQLAGGV